MRLQRHAGLLADQPNGYGLTLRRSDGPADILANRLIAWIAASAALWTAHPDFIQTATDARHRNSSGYNLISSQFIDEHRVTTRYFHVVTEAFWRNLFAQRLQPTGRYLEVGPGRGWLRALGWPPGANYRGLELSEGMRDLNPDKELIDLGPADALPYAARSFDGVFGSLIDPLLLPNFLMEVQRVLAPTGCFAATIPAADWAQKLRPTNSATTEFLLRSGESATVTSFCYTAQELRSLLEITGFDQIEIAEHRVTPNSEMLPPAVRAVVDGSNTETPIVLSWTARCSDRLNMLWAAMS